MQQAFYNEHDPYAAEWLRNLIMLGHIAPGVVDERDIRDLRPDELSGYSQCHFFAGIGIWSHALRRAGWRDDQPIWTGSCPCQPFSAAGGRAGVADERHLWPHWHHLIRECRPPVVLGEQVASKDGLGWLNLVQADLEAAGYASGASDLCAAGFGGAHIRQRLYFVGLVDAYVYGAEYVSRTGMGAQAASHRGNGGLPGERLRAGLEGAAIGMADDDEGLEGRLGVSERRDQRAARASGLVGGLALASSDECKPRGNDRTLSRPKSESSGLRDDAIWLIRDPRKARSFDDANVDWLLCRNPAGEPSWRPVEPGTFPLAHGVATRMDKLRAYGNGLDAETATQFCGAVMETLDGER